MTKSYRRYLKTFALVHGGLLAATILLNVLVDPHGVFRALSIEGLREYRHHRARKAKAEQLRGAPYDLVLIGTSRAEAGMDPSAGEWGARVYNAALRGGSLYELNLVAEYVLEEARPRAVVFCIDLVSLGANRAARRDFEESRFNPALDRFEYWIGSAIGRSSLQRSFNTVRAASKGEAQDNRLDGFRDKPLRSPPRHRELFRRNLETFLVDPTTYNAFQYAPERLEHLKLVAVKARRLGVHLTFVIPPVHALQLEAMRWMEVWDDFERAKRDLTALVAETNRVLADAPPITLWDFTGYSGYVAEPVPGAGSPEERMRYFFESSHFSPELGDLVIARIRDHPSADPSFGVQLDSTNIDAHLGRIRAERERYVEENPEEIEWLAGLYRSTSERRNQLARRATALRSRRAAPKGPGAGDRFDPDDS